MSESQLLSQKVVQVPSTGQNLSTSSSRRTQAKSSTRTGRAPAKRATHISGSVVESSAAAAESGISKRNPLREMLRVLWDGSNTRYSNKLTLNELINAESNLGRTLFGPIPEGHQREFFESERNVWFWHESYTDTAGVCFEVTIRYEVRPTGVFKRVNKGDYQRIEGAELDNFRTAARSYLELIKTKLYC